ncbi:MAG: Zn-ribbon domain-containing OB-fold protein [Actinomycetota bacterium]|nr:Zn-ribbon domain-containing OB-fold protein [Actinomycetota bacterium]
MSSGLPVAKVHATPETQPYWDGLAEDRLVLPRCDSCGFVIWYPRPLCPSCHSSGVSWFEASGRGRIYSFTIVRKGQGRWRECSPYVLAYVELDEGPRVLTNVVTDDVDSLAVDDVVTLSVDHRDDADEPALTMRFTPT